MPPPAVESYVVNAGRRTVVQGHRTTEYYPRQYATDDSLASNLRFALRYEPIDLTLLVAALKAADPRELEAWIRDEPTGAYSRRAWFFYETFTGRTLDVEDVASGNYVEALDPKRHIVGARRNATRQRVADNLLGDRDFCPMVRLTPTLNAAMALQVDEEARELVRHYDPATLARAVNYLYTKETRSTFAIEHETPSTSRAERFIAALKAAPTFDSTNKRAIVRLQHDIVDPRYAADDWRDFQNFVGETVSGYREEVHFLCPRPEDVPTLMDGWTRLTSRLQASGVDAVVAAAISAFAFVFVHPFEDGNGRIHRFMIHHVLANRGYSPPGVIFPVSAAILRDQRAYDEVLESFSRPLFDCIDWRWTPDRKVEVTGETVDLYRYFDATLFAEYLYGRVVDTVRVDLKEELGFISRFDQAFEALRGIVDMPDRRASLLIRLCMQNGGRLSGSKRNQFEELSDQEVSHIEAAIQRAVQYVDDPDGGALHSTAYPGPAE